MGEHVGALSDSIDNEAVGGARARMAQVMKPTGKVYRGGMSDLGDGDRCPIDGHGKMYAFNGKQWCPHQSHDMGVPRNG
jgi:hypothetical protein